MVNESHAGSQLTSAYKWEVLGDDVVALDSDGGRVFRLSGPSAAVAAFLLNGVDHGLTTESYDETLAALADEGLVVVNEPGISRRKMIGASAAAVAGISILMLPTAAAAASGGVSPSGDGSGVQGFNAPVIQGTGTTVTWV